MQELDRRIMRVVEEYPGHPESYALLGAVESELGRHDVAIKLYETALADARGTQKWGLYRNLTISYAEAGRYQQAYDAAGSTIALRRSVMGDKYFVYAVAKAEAGLGKFADAQTALRVIAAKDPSVKQDPDFRQTIDFVFDRMKADQKGTR
jgi:tetratricopeptide (TPR) repeat protein